MRKNILLFLILFFQFAFSQQNLDETEKLAVTCKIWGFLKYYHPNVANGDFNWQTQLLNVLPKIEESKNKQEFSLILENWINSLGVVKKNPEINKTNQVEYFDKNFDLSWINNSKLFTNSISEKLKFIEENRFQGEQYYVGELKGGNIFVKNEDFSNFQSPEKNQRILALFTYWNIIEYFFPYKYLMDSEWDITLEEMLPHFIQAQNDDEFYLAMQKLICKINDSHAVFFKYKHKKKYLPIIGRIIDNKLIITEILNLELTELYSIKAGDIITKINNKSIKDLVLENRNLICASNESSYLHKIIEPILSGKEDKITLEFLNGNKSVTKTIDWTEYNSNRYVLKSHPKYSLRKEKIKIIKSNIGYVNMEFLKIKDIPEMIEKFKTTKAIIFDLRNYPNGTFEGISNFLNSDEKLFAIYTKPDLTYPGRYKWIEGSTVGTKNSNNYKGKVIVLLNEESVSQSEWTAMCFQTADNVTLIGSQTAGADGNITNIDYMSAFHTCFSGIGVYYPDKRETQRIGIIPDIQIKPTLKGMKNGKDEVLERALKFIKSGK